MNDLDSSQDIENHQPLPSDPTCQWDFTQFSPKSQNKYSLQEGVSFEHDTESPRLEESQNLSNQSGNQLSKVLSFNGLCLLFMSFSLIILRLAHENKINSLLKLSPGPFQYISANLKADPIMEIQLIDQESSCPSGFEPLPLDIWPGTVAGCLCTSEALYPMTCKDTEYWTCNVDIPGNSPINVYKWGGSIWCGKKAVLGTDYLKKTECPSGYQEYYPGGCFVASLKDCPITHIGISLTGITNKLSKPGPDGKDRYLTMTRKQGEMPLIDFKITPNDIPCFDQNALTTTKEGFVYPLVKALDRYSCGKYGLDSHFSTRLDSQNSYELYFENSFPKSVMDLPHFQTNAEKTQSILSSRIKMKTTRNDHCLDMNTEYTSLPTRIVNNEIERFPYIEHRVLVFIILIRPLFLLALCTCQSCFLKCVAQSWNIVFGFLLFLLSILVIIHFGLYKATKPVQDYLARYNSLDCFVEGQGGDVIRDHLQILKNIEVFYWLSLTLLILNLIFVYFSVKRSRNVKR